ncbi:MAG: DUF3870 domain-containing protein [Peptococcales bacterium]
MAERKCVYVCGNSRCPDNSSIGSVYETFAVELVIDLRTEKIIDASCLLLTDTGRNFVKSLLVDRHVIDDFNNIIEDVELYYQAVPQKALVCALKVAQNRYKQSRQKISDKVLTLQEKCV